MKIVITSAVTAILKKGWLRKRVAYVYREPDGDQWYFTRTDAEVPHWTNHYLKSAVLEYIFKIKESKEPWESEGKLPQVKVVKNSLDFPYRKS